MDTVTHLGHILSYGLDDSEDTVRCSRDMIRKANCMLHLFSGVDPLVKTKLLQCYCLSMYGCVTWNLSSKSLRFIEVAFNKLILLCTFIGVFIIIIIIIKGSPSRSPYTLGYTFNILNSTASGFQTGFINRSTWVE